MRTHLANFWGVFTPKLHRANSKNNSKMAEQEPNATSRDVIALLAHSSHIHRKGVFVPEMTTLSDGHKIHWIAKLVQFSAIFILSEGRYWINKEPDLNTRKIRRIYWRFFGTWTWTWTWTWYCGYCDWKNSIKMREQTHFFFLFIVILWSQTTGLFERPPGQRLYGP